MAIEGTAFVQHLVVVETGGYIGRDDAQSTAEDQRSGHGGNGQLVLAEKDTDAGEDLAPIQTFGTDLPLCVYIAVAAFRTKLIRAPLGFGFLGGGDLFLFFQLIQKFNSLIGIVLVCVGQIGHQFVDSGFHLGRDSAGGKLFFHFALDDVLQGKHIPTQFLKLGMGTASGEKMTPGILHGRTASAEEDDFLIRCQNVIIAAHQIPIDIRFANQTDVVTYNAFFI